MGVLARIGDVFAGNWEVGRLVDSRFPTATAEQRASLITTQKKVDRYRTAMRAYSEGNGRSGGWKPSSREWGRRGDMGPRSYGTVDIAHLRHKGRHLSFNNEHVKHCIRILTDWSVGTGFNIAPKPAAKTAREKATAKVVEATWRRWFVTTQECDVERDQNFHGLTRLVRKTILDQGECIVRLRPRKLSDGLAVPLAIEVMEPDFFYTGPRPGTVRAGNIYDAGKEYAPTGELEAVHLYKTHPLEPGGDRSISRMPVINPITGMRQIAHLFDKERPGQKRGLPRACAVYNLSTKQADLRTSVLNRTRATSKVNWWLKPPANATSDEQRMFGEDVNEDGERTRYSLDTGEVAGPAANDDFIDPDQMNAYVQLQLLDDNSVVTLPPGWDKAESIFQNFADYAPLMTDFHRTMAVGMGVPYELMTGDLKGTTYSSGKIGLLEFRKEMESVQDYLILNWCQFVWDGFVLAGRLAGLWRETTIPCDFRADRFPSIEPEKDANALIAKLNAGLISLKKARLELGEDPDELRAEIAEQIAEGEAMGVNFRPGAFSKSGSASAAAPAAPANDPAANPSDDNAGQGVA